MSNEDSCQIIKRSEHTKILEYTYHGSDNSILYEYFYSPLAEVMVEYLIPEYVACPKQPEHSCLSRSRSSVSSSWSYLIASSSVCTPRTTHRWWRGG